MKRIDRTCSIAPMLDWTDRHYRYFMRLITPHSLLYTEMITTGAILFGDSDRHLRFSQQESPVALQLGGSDPKALAECARIGEEYGYAEINLNVGCPSDRVQSGRFGACLMKAPKLVAECVQAMQAVVSIPVTVKTRIGVDDHDSYDFLCDFIQSSADAGCETFIIHARKAWLKGLSPKQNREIPPLCYDVVYRLKKDFPQLEIVINGGIESILDIKSHLEHIDGVMLGRQAYKNPYLFAQIENDLFCFEPLCRSAVVENYVSYMEEQLKEGVRMSTLTRPLLCLYKGLPYAKLWRREISNSSCKEKDVRFITKLLAQVAQ